MSGSGSSRDTRDDDVVVRRAEHGWVVGSEEVSDLTSAMVLADLFAADRGGADRGGADRGGADRGGAASAGDVPPAAAPIGRPNVSDTAKPGTPREEVTEADEAARLAVTVTQLEHALASRVRVEQAIGVLAERHRLRPREAFDLLRGAARSRGQRVAVIAQDVVASTANPLLRLPEELARKLPAPREGEPRQRGRSFRRARQAEQS